MDSETKNPQIENRKAQMLKLENFKGIINCRLDKILMRIFIPHSYLYGKYEATLNSQLA